MPDGSDRRGFRSLAAASLRGAGRAGVRGLTHALGGAERTRVIVLLAAVLALSSADTATVGASATSLRSALHVNNTDIGLLVTVTSLVPPAATLPFGVLIQLDRIDAQLGGALHTGDQRDEDHRADEEAGDLDSL